MAYEKLMKSLMITKIRKREKSLGTKD